MYAVIASGGKQYRVSKGDTIRLEKLEGVVGSDLTFSNVLLLADEENISIGQPIVKDAIVKAHIVEQGKAKKIIVFKYKKRKRYRRKRGHRQAFTAIKVDQIGHISEELDNQVIEQTSDVAPEIVSIQASEQSTEQISPQVQASEHSHEQNLEQQQEVSEQNSEQNT